MASAWRLSALSKVWRPASRLASSSLPRPFSSNTTSREAASVTELLRASKNNGAVNKQSLSAGAQGSSQDIDRSNSEAVLNLTHGQNSSKTATTTTSSTSSTSSSSPFKTMDDLVMRDCGIQTTTTENAEYESQLKQAFEDIGGFRGVSERPFSESQAAILMAPIDPVDIEIKPDGLLYLPEIKYRRILNRAFLPGGWGMVPRGRHTFHARVLSCDFALYVQGRFVALARGENEVFDEKQLVTAMEAVKSNALVRCCKDLGIASELWDPKFVAKFKSENCETVKVRHVVRNMRAVVWRLKGATTLQYPYELIPETKESAPFGQFGSKK